MHALKNKSDEMKTLPIAQSLLPAFSETLDQIPINFS